jgi:hypothetical protein
MVHANRQRLETEETSYSKENNTGLKNQFYYFLGGVQSQVQGALKNFYQSKIPFTFLCINPRT